MRRSVGEEIIRRPIRSNLFSCNNANLLPEGIAAVAGGADEVRRAVSCDIWLLSLMQPPVKQPPLCRQTSSRKKPAARMDTRLGSPKVAALACLSQQSSARWFQSSSFGFKLFFPPGVGLLQRFLCFNSAPSFLSTPAETGRGAFQPPLPVHPSLHNPPRPGS